MYRARVLIVDDEFSCIKLMQKALKDKYDLSIANNGKSALEIVNLVHPDLILMDIHMPEMSGLETCYKLKQSPATQSIPILMVTSSDRRTNERIALEMGANDFITKPIDPNVVQNRVKNYIELVKHRHRLTELVALRTEELLDTQEVILKRLAIAGEFRDDVTGRHVLRIELFTKTLLEHLNWKNDHDRQLAGLAGRLHDVGKIGIPDSILHKPGPLDLIEWETMKMHTSIGQQIIGDGQALVIKMAKDIANGHHENWDGTGYPLGLKGQEIPFLASVIHLVDVYDALRSRRPYKSSFSHIGAVKAILNGSPDQRTLPQQFDPKLLKAFEETQGKFEDISRHYDDKNL